MKLSLVKIEETSVGVQAEHMLEDLAKLADAYMAALERLARSLEGRPAMEDAGAAVGELVEALRVALRADEAAARHRLQQALQVCKQ